MKRNAFKFHSFFIRREMWLTRSWTRILLIYEEKTKDVDHQIRKWWWNWQSIEESIIDQSRRRFSNTKIFFFSSPSEKNEKHSQVNNSRPLTKLLNPRMQYVSIHKKNDLVKSHTDLNETLKKITRHESISFFDKYYRSLPCVNFLIEKMK
jgi:hypothetical protein